MWDKQKLELYFTLAKYDLKQTVATTKFGFLWWLIDPIVLMLVYYFVIVIIFQKGEERYHLFILIGIIFWQLFSKSVVSGMRSLKTNSSLMKQTTIPIYLVIFVPSSANTYLAFIGLIVVIVWNIFEASMLNILVLPLLILTGVMSYGFGLILSCLYILFQDLGRIIPYILRLGFFITPILYSQDRVLGNDEIPEFLKTLFLLNPMQWVIESARGVLLYNQVFSLENFVYFLSFSFLLIFIGMYLIKSNKNILLKKV